MLGARDPYHPPKLVIDEELLVPVYAGEGNLSTLRFFIFAVPAVGD